MYWDSHICLGACDSMVNLSLQSIYIYMAIEVASFFICGKFMGIFSCVCVSTNFHMW